MTVILCGLGPGGAQGLTLGALEAMRAHPTYLRTERHESVQTLRAYGVAFESFDALYETSADFDALCTLICQRIYAAAQEKDVVYAVPAGAGFADATVQALCAFLKERGVAVRALPGVGYGESAALAAGGLDGAVVISAQGLDARWVNTRVPLVVCEMDNRLLAGDVKILLENWYPPQHRIRSVLGDKIAEFPLCELDRQGQYSHKLSIVVPPVDILALSRYDFTRLQEIAAILRGRSDRFEGCPWDMEQTHASMRACMIEEAYEAADAIDQQDPDQLCDELGDVLLQVALHAQVASEYDEFDAMDVTTAVCRKMIRRHPHVFGDATARTSDQVLAAWEQIKQTETTPKSEQERLLSVPRALPALVRAAKVLKKSGKTMDDAAVRQALARVAGQTPPDETEFGAALMALVCLARTSGVDAETALSKAVDRMIAAYDAANNPAQ